MMFTLTNDEKLKYYQALLTKGYNYEGLFYVGVKTTGIFCRPTCPARKPKIENCEFFQTAQQALLASYRPCKRCQPLSHPNQVSDSVKRLVEAVEANPEKRWKDADFKAFGLDVSTARRQFKKRFGMTFVAYARARRIGIAMKQIRQGEKVINAQIDAGYESGSGFRDAFSKFLGAPPSNLKQQYQILKSAWIDTPLGPMVAVSDDSHLILLEFVDRRGLEKEIEKLRNKTKSAIIPGDSSPIQSITREIELYFAGQLQQFKTPIKMLGSPFQKSVWEALLTIPYGEIRSYKQQATLIGKSESFRAVANANGANQLAVIIPCHRIINTNGELGGYGGGLDRKRWLIELEKQNKSF